MANQTITTLLSLLSTFRPQYQESILVNQLNSFFNFDHNIFLIESRINANHYIDTKNKLVSTTPPPPMSLFHFENVADNVTGLDDLTEVKSKNTFMIIASANVTLESNLNLLFRVKKIQQLQKSMKIGIFFTDFVSSDQFEKLFRWLWKHRIIYVFAAYLSNQGVPHGTSFGPLLNIFTFNPFGTFRVVNVTGSEAFESYFLGQKTNFEKDPLTYLFKHDMVNSESVKCDAHVWQSVCGVLNATFTLVPTENQKELEKLFYHGDTIDVLYHSYALDLTLESFTYPIKTELVIIVVPEALPYPEFTAYLQAIMSDHFFAYSSVTIVMLICLLTITRYIKQKRFSFFQCTADVLNLLMHDNAAIKYQELRRAEVFVILPLTFAGFFVVNGIMSTLQSYLTRPVMQPQMNSIDDVYNSPLPITVRAGYWEKLTIDSLTFLLNRTDWNDRVDAIAPIAMAQEMNSLNNSRLYSIFYKHMIFLLDSHKRRNIKVYRIANKFYLSRKMFSYYVRPKFPFIERLNEILHWMQSAGLYDKWWAESLYKTSEYVATTPVTDVDTFPIPKLIFFGWIASCVVFVIEIFWARNKLSKRLQQCLKKIKV